MSKTDIKSLTADELKQTLKELGFPKFKSKQIYKWLHKGVASFEEMTDQSKKDRAVLEENFYIANAEIVKKQVSKLDGTVKYLFRMNDGDCVESVLMQYHHGYSICISTQVGCKMGCTFCATGRSGFSRNLTASEILSQIQAAQNDTGIRISNVVLMGMGEPLENYENVLRFLELVSSEDGMNIGMRHISLSTCGIVDKIYDLADRKLQLTLSVSLHAPNDKLRSMTMPINKKYGVDELLQACDYYTKTTGRRISFEYAMIAGHSDTEECAKDLVSRLKGMLCHLNLIPVNSVDGTPYTKSSKASLEKFCRILEKGGINTTVRRTLGSDIDASCGQLRRRYAENSAKSE